MIKDIVSENIQKAAKELSSNGYKYITAELSHEDYRSLTSFLKMTVSQNIENPSMWSFDDGDTLIGIKKINSPISYISCYDKNYKEHAFELETLFPVTE